MNKLFVSLVLGLLLTGCSNQAFKPEYRSQVTRVKVLPVICSEKDMTYIGREQAVGMALGAGAGAAVGVAAGASRAATAAMSGAGVAAGMKAGELASMPTAQAILYNMQSHDIQLAEVVRQSFREQLAANGRFIVVGDQEDADAEIQLTVMMWGFALTQGFSSVVYPTMTLRGTMKRGEEVIWQHTEGVTAFNGQNTYGYEPLRYRTEPELLRTALVGISRIDSQFLVSSLER